MLDLCIVARPMMSEPVYCFTGFAAATPPNEPKLLGRSPASRITGALTTGSRSFLTGSEVRANLGTEAHFCNIFSYEACASSCAFVGRFFVMVALYTIFKACKYPMRLKSMLFQLAYTDPVPVQLPSRVNEQELLDSLKYPLLWVLEQRLSENAWIPREVDHQFIKELQQYRGNDSKFEAKLQKLGLFEDAPISIELSKAVFAENRMVIIKGLFCKGLLEFLEDYFMRRLPLTTRLIDLPGIKRVSANDTPLMRLIHEHTSPLASKIIAEPIKTSYSFSALYEKGSSLPAHTDRPQCVYNASLIIASSPRISTKVWPLFIKTPTGLHASDLEPGDLVFYSGTQDLHWRDQMPEPLDTVLGCFFHYVPVSFTGTLA